MGVRPRCSFLPASNSEDCLACSFPGSHASTGSGWEISLLSQPEGGGPVSDLPPPNLSCGLTRAVLSHQHYDEGAKGHPNDRCDPCLRPVVGCRCGLRGI